VPRPAPAPSVERARVAAVEFLERISAELSQGPLNLPCFPDIIPRIRESLSDPNSTVDDIVRIAGTEPLLTARLLQTANSAVFNRGGRPLSNLRHAITRLGHHLVLSVTTVFAIQQMKADASLRAVAKPLHDLWEKSIAVASICQVIARHLSVPPDKVFLAGLLHGIGHFYIMVRATNASQGIEYRVLTDRALERHAAMGRSVLKKWRFETAVCEAVGHQRDYGRQSKRAGDIADVLIASVVLAEVLLEREGDLEVCDGIQAFASLRLNQADSAAILKHTEQTLDTVRAALGC